MSTSRSNMEDTPDSTRLAAFCEERHTTRTENT